jgi:leader peptidase (prepilin peptidase)/N-methyltransferase
LADQGPEAPDALISEIDETMPAILALPAGLILGSFATVVAHRVPRGQSIVGGRSHCPGCGATIAAYDNVPVLSWLVLRGHCRSCGARVPASYPLTELAMAGLFAATVLILGTGDPGELALGLSLCALLVIVTLTDLERRLIPNAVLLVGAVLGVAIAAVSDPGSLAERGVAAAGAGGALLCVALAYPRGMGMGDVKLAAVMGLYLGSAVVPALLVGFGAGSLFGLWLMARHGAGARKQKVPFGPFLALGGVVGLWYGDAIVAWYVSTFFHG